MAWEPPTSEERRAHALAMREQAREGTRAAIARQRTTSVVMMILAPLVGLGVSAFVLTEVPADQRLLALVPVTIGIVLGAAGAWMASVCGPLPTELLAHGVATPAVVLEVGTVGPTIEMKGGSVVGSFSRQRYRLEVRPSTGEPYEVEVRTFDGPMLMSIGQPPLTVYVDSKNRTRVCPDWSTLPPGA